MFGIGFFELVLIGLAVIIFVKPKDLPQFMRKVGLLYKNLRNTYEETLLYIKDISSLDAKDTSGGKEEAEKGQGAAPQETVPVTDIRNPQQRGFNELMTPKKRTKSSKSRRLTKSGKSIKSTKPTKPKKPATTRQQVKVAGSTKSVKPTGLKKPTKSKTSTKLNKSTTTRSPVKLAGSTKSVKPAKLKKPTKSIKSTKLAKLKKPTKSMKSK